MFKHCKYDMIHSSTAMGLTPGGSSTVHIYTQTIHTWCGRKVMRLIFF